MRSAWLLLVLLAMTSPHISNSNNIIVETLDILKLIKEVATSLEDTWDLIGYLPLGNNNSPLIMENQRKIMQRLEEVNNGIEQMQEKQSEYFNTTIETLRRDFFAESMLSHKMTYVTDISRSIMQRYSDMKDYEKYKQSISPFTLRNFAEWIVKPDDTSVGFLLERLHNYVFGMVDDDDAASSLFAQLVTSYEKNNAQVCSSQLSPQQFAYNLYSKATLVELRGFIMLKFSWMVLSDYDFGNFTQEMSLMREKYDARMQHSQRLLTEIIAKTGRTYWRCDPQPGQHVPGKTYDRITRLLQGYVENEINLNKDSSCFASCEEYQNVRVEGCAKDKDNFCSRQPKCKGRVHSCRFIEADMNVCQTVKANNSRRYQYISYDTGRTLGNNGRPFNCQDDRLESWSSYLFWRCNYCFCLCDEKGPLSDRYFSLRDTLSDFDNNMIITGARFVKEQRVFHLQLQQGQLLPGGQINQSSISWIPLESFDVSHVDIRSGFDYYELDVDSRSIDLDEIAAANDSVVVTGARFRVVNKHLNLEVRFTSFDFITGLLLQPNVNSFWQGNNAREQREKLSLTDPNVPTNTQLMSIPLSKNNQFMDFISSSIDLDAAQETVPYLDVQDVVTKPATPLAGLGIYHKGTKGYGGFLAPKIITYNLMPQILQPIK